MGNQLAGQRSSPSLRRSDSRTKFRKSLRRKMAALRSFSMTSLRSGRSIQSRSLSMTSTTSARTFSRYSRKPWQQSTLSSLYSASKDAWPVPIYEALFLPEYSIKGAVVESDFEVETVVARGAFGNVYRVRRVEAEKPLAMKIMSKAEVIANDAIQQCKDEVTIQYCLGHHPFIVQVFHYWQSRRNLYIVMEFVPFGELFALWQKLPHFPEELSKLYLCELALVLEYLHSSGVIYRDLKMENVLITSGGHLLVTDFGLSKWLTANERTYTICGTLQYMAPEVLSAQNFGYGHEADWWTLGILIYALVAGFFPVYGAKDHLQMLDLVLRSQYPIPQNCSTAMRSVLARLLTKNPSFRLSSLQSLKYEPLLRNVDLDRVYHKTISPSDFFPDGFRDFASLSLDLRSAPFVSAPITLGTGDGTGKEGAGKVDAGDAARKLGEARVIVGVPVAREEIPNIGAEVAKPGAAGRNSAAPKTGVDLDQNSNESRWTRTVGDGSGGVGGVFGGSGGSDTIDDNQPESLPPKQKSPAPMDELRRRQSDPKSFQQKHDQNFLRPHRNPQSQHNPQNAQQQQLKPRHRDQQQQNNFPASQNQHQHNHQRVQNLSPGQEWRDHGQSPRLPIKQRGTNPPPQQYRQHWPNGFVAVRNEPSRHATEERTHLSRKQGNEPGSVGRPDRRLSSNDDRTNPSSDRSHYINDDGTSDEGGKRYSSNDDRYQPNDKDQRFDNYHPYFFVAGNHDNAAPRRRSHRDEEFDADAIAAMLRRSRVSSPEGAPSSPPTTPSWNGGAMLETKPGVNREWNRVGDEWNRVADVG